MSNINTNIPYGADYGIQVIFTSTPNDEKIKFEEDIEKEYFVDFKRNYDNSQNDFLYKPLKFYILGDYDVCYITLINNFKFSHRVFENLENPNNLENTNNNHVFQSYSGFVLNEKETVEKIFSKGIREKYVGIYNIKLNNALLYGNGLKYIAAVKKFLIDFLNIPFLLVQTFSWFEISLIFFTDNIEDFDRILKKIRTSTFFSLEKDFVLTNSLYHLLTIDPARINQASLVSDTISYFGFNEEVIKSDTQFNETFKIEIEWHVKPGHLSHLHRLLKQNNSGRVIFGRSDYIVQESNIANIIKLIREIIEKPKKYYDHIRKIRSFPFFDYKSTEEKNREVIDIEKELNKIAFKQSEIFELKNNLKKLSISRELRNKIIKAFANFNHGVVDPVLFPFFVDFKVFLRIIIESVKVYVDEISHKPVDSLEDDLAKRMLIFKNSFQIRFLNGYLFENISTFSINFNSSIQLLLMSYNTLIYEYAQNFFKDGNYYPIILLNERDTISNYFSINYSVHHLTSPEFIFSTINKEIVNAIKYEKIDSKYEKDKESSLTYDDEKINEFIINIVEKINESFLDDLFDRGLFDIHYLIADIIRFVVNYDMDFSLFYYWFWTYNFQNASLYDKSGMMNEDRFRMELLRIWLIKEIFQVEDDIINILADDMLLCPIPELQSYWDRYQVKIRDISKKINKHIFKNGINENFITNLTVSIFKIYFKNYRPSSEIKNSPFSIMDKITYNKYLERRKKIFSSANLESHEFMQKLFIGSLQGLKELNKSTIKTLKRDWNDGKILKQYKLCYDDVCYVIDSFGGLFFKDFNKTNEYFRFNAKVILEVIDFSYKKKSKFILKTINGNRNG